MNSHPDYSPKKIGEIIKIRGYALVFALLGIFFTAIAYGGSGVKEILTPEERLWLTQNQPRLVLAVETGYAPFVFLDPKDQPTGFAHDYMRLIESKLDTRFKQRRFSSLNDIFEKVHSGEIHIVNAVTNTPERAKFLAMTSSFVSVPNVIVVKKERSGQMREKDLLKLKVSLVKSYAVTEHLKNTNPGFAPNLVPDDLTALLNVSFGQSDAAVIDLATASYLISQKGISNLRVAGEVDFNIRLAIGSPIGEPVLHSILQKGLDAVTEEERQEIRNRWISAPSQGIFADRRFWVVAGSVLFIVLVVIAVILIWNRILRQQLAFRTEALAKERKYIAERNQLELQLSRRLRHRDIMERITQISLNSTSIEELLGKVLDEILAIFNADRAWFLYPCDPDAPSWSVLMERTRPEWPGAFAQGLVIPMTPEVAEVFREVRASTKPLPYGPATSRCIPAAVAEQFSIRSQIQMALHPRVDSPWAFGLHHCAQAHAYDEDELLLFNDIGQRVADALSSMIILKNLYESEENLNRAQAVGQIGSWLLDIPANRLEWSAETYRMFGIPQRETIDLETFVAAIHPDDRNFVLKAWGEAMTGAPYDIEHRIVVDGQARWVRERARIERDAEGRPLTGIGTVQDVTERKQVEEKLRASEQKFMRLFMEIPIPLGVAGKEGVITHFNNKFIEVFGYTVDDVPTLDEWWLKAYPDEIYRRWVLDNWNNAVANAVKEGTNVESAEYNVTCKNGAERIVIIGGSAVEGGVLAIFNDITERKKAEEELRFKAQLLDSVSDSIFVHEDGNFVYLNEAAWKTRGYTREELMGMNLRDLDTPEYAALLESRRKEMAEKGRGIFESAHRLKDGSVMPIEVTARIGEFGGRKLILGVARDITERKNTGKKLAATLKELESIIRVNPDILYVINPKGELIKWNPTLEKLCGLTPEQMMNRPAVEFVCEEDRPTVMRGIAEVFEKGSASIEVRFIRNDGALVTHLCNGAVWKNPDGEVMGFVGVGKDITERKQAEGVLRESEARFRSLVETTSDWIWEVDENIVFTYASPKIHDILGYTVAEIIGKTPFDLMSPDEAKRVADIAGVLAAARKLFASLENINLHKDGHQVVIETSGVPVIDTEGKFHGYRGINRDITERKEYEEELKRSNAELEQFSYVVSHDMRQPLRMISSYLQLLEMGLGGQLDGEQRGYLNFAVEGAKRIDQMLVALLEYSRVGRMGEAPTWVESRAVLDEALQFIQPAITEAQANLNISGDWPRIFASHDEILRLFQNLIGNAAKFRVAGRTPEITVSSKVDKNEWRLCVADNGVGIIPDQIKRLFQVFQRLQLRTAYEGNGVGLALCRKIAEHHKGRIWAESAGEGRGSRFCVVLPVLRGKI